MKIMKRYFLATILLVSFSGICIGQPSGNSPDSLASKEARSLKQKLSLTNTQAEQIKIVTKNYRIESDSLQRLQLDTSAKKSVLKDALHRYRVTMQDILTTEQFTTYRNLIIQRRNTLRAWAQEHGNVLNEIEDDF